jgi:hypothetical protein
LENFSARLREIIKEVMAKYGIEEGKRKNIVVRGGKRVKKFTADTGQKMKGGKAVRMGAAEKVNRKRGSRHAALKKKGKQSRISKKRKKSMKRRKQFGLH